MVLTETAYAKINLALHIRSRRDDGYHVLETLFAFAEDGDVLTAEAAEDVSLSIHGPFAEGLSAGEDNLVIRAVQAVRTAFGINQGVRLTLDKKLPVAAGIGGGSADAAAAIRLVSRLWGFDLAHPTFHDIAAALGADVPACLASQTVRGDGVGDELTTVDGSQLSRLPLLLLNPRIACPTGPVFKAWGGVDRGPMSNAVTLDAIASDRNDLEAPALSLVPEIGTVLEALAAQDGVRFVRMSGSGATCLAIFASEQARDAAQARLSHYWAMATRIR